MSNNCLVTKFKGTSTSDLPVYNELTLKVNKSVRLSLRIKGSVGTKVYIKDGTGFFSLSEDMSNPFTEDTINSTSIYTVYLSNGEYTVGITNKYDIEILLLDSGGVKNQTAFDFDALRYLSKLQMLLIAGTSVYGDISAVKDLPNIEVISLYRTNISGNFKALLDNDHITYVTLSSDVYGTLAVFAAIANRNNLPGEYISLEFNDSNKGYVSEGSLNDLVGTSSISAIVLQGSKNKISGGKLESLAKNTHINIISISELEDYTNFDGSVEAFVAGQISNGRTTCPISNPILCPWLLHLATFGGNKYNKQGYMYLTWESTSKIAVFQGGSGGIDNTTTVYYSSGYSASDFPGKTAIPV